MIFRASKERKDINTLGRMKKEDIYGSLKIF
jgi:hypothetical protein